MCRPSVRQLLLQIATIVLEFLLDHSDFFTGYTTYVRLSSNNPRILKFHPECQVFFEILLFLEFLLDHADFSLDILHV